MAAAGSAAGAQQSTRAHVRDAAWLARILRIEDTRRDEPAFLDSLLENGGATARARAAVAAGRIGARRHLPALRRRTADPDTSVAASAWFALALLRDTGAVSSAAGSMHAPPSVAAEAARLLGEVGESGRSGIVAALADSSVDSGVREAVLLAAARLRPVPASAVMPWVTSPDSTVAWRAAYALARGRSAAGIWPLLAVSRSPVTGVREQVARGLSRFVTGDSLGDSAAVALHMLVTDEEPHVRVSAVRSLASYGARARAEVVAALHDPDAGVRVTAAQSLGSVLDSTAAPWAAAYDADTAFAVRQAVAEGAAARGVSLAGTEPWRRSSDWRCRAAAVSLDAHGPASDAALRLHSWLADRDPRVRAAATGGLATLMDSAAARELVRASLRQSLRDVDPFVRAAAMGGLANGASTADLSLALDAYHRGANDRDVDARLAFWQLADSAIARARTSLPDSVTQRLAALPRPADPLERIAASRIPRFAAWADSAGTARPIAWYEARARDAIRRPTRTARIQTERGTMDLALSTWDAPLTVHNFVSLADRHYFDGQRFHRVVPNFVIQAGDPRGDGSGGPGYAIRDEINRERYARGTLGMALSGPDTGGSQFFVTHSPQPHLDGGYTVFGQLQSGAAVLDRIVQGDRIVRITIR